MHKLWTFHHAAQNSRILGSLLHRPKDVRETQPASLLHPT